MKDAFSLSAKTTVITGGTSGIGAAIVQAYLENGAEVYAIGTNPEKAELVRQTAGSLRSRLHFLLGSISGEDCCQKLLQELYHKAQRVDILVNSAGINTLIPAEDYDDARFYQIMNLNLLSLHRMCREIGKHYMIPQRYGRIINLSSVKSLLGTDKNYSAYCASKGAVNMYTKQLACEGGKYGITVNAIAPTFVRTPICEKLLSDQNFYQSLIDRITLGRIGSLEDMANAAIYLGSDAGSFVSGQILAVDGGLTSRQ